MSGASWSVEDGPATYQDSPYGDAIAIGYVWTISRAGETRSLRIEAVPNAVYNELVVRAILLNQLAADEPPQRVLILSSGDLQYD